MNNRSNLPPVSAVPWFFRLIAVVVTWFATIAFSELCIANLPQNHFFHYFLWMLNPLFAFGMIFLFTLAAKERIFRNLSLKLAEWRLVFASVVAVLICSYLLEKLSDYCLTKLEVKYEKLQFIAKIIQNDPNWAILTIIFISGIILAPLWEELFFRHWLFNLFYRTPNKIVLGVAIVITSAIFSLIHFFLLGALSLFAIGVITQLAYLKSGKISVPVIIHLCNNLIAFFLAYFKVDF